MIKPVGYQVLVRPREGEEKTKGGIILTDSSRDKDTISSVVAEVIALGEDAYKDMNKFPQGPWVAVGDWVILGKHVGSRFRYKDKEYRLVDDDKILGVTDEPSELTRVV